MQTQTSYGQEVEVTYKESQNDFEMLLQKPVKTLKIEPRKLAKVKVKVCSLCGGNHMHSPNAFDIIEIPANKLTPEHILA